ncbi:uncharacterized protein LOC117652361 [Thrips palmi]|uniref:Uncharacterized protein LOC117652361 n=1 Tax=Thrips palmi TaxID=161013 RepID=A0A6P9A566_THRPL|nr:uncharacterized protein LOC117652361 [Thrips palmi]
MTYVDFPINSHLERLAYDEVRENPSLFSDTWMSILGGTFGFFGVMSYNVARFKPAYTGVWRYPIAMAAGVYAGLIIRDWRREKVRTKWAKIKHYIELHPEDFPPYPARTKIGDTLSPWVPMRTGW